MKSDWPRQNCARLQRRTSMPHESHLPALFENPDSTRKLSTCSKLGARQSYFPLSPYSGLLYIYVLILDDFAPNPMILIHQKDIGGGGTRPSYQTVNTASVVPPFVENRQASGQFRPDPLPGSAQACANRPVCENSDGSPIITRCPPLPPSTSDRILFG